MDYVGGSDGIISIGLQEFERTKQLYINKDYTQQIWTGERRGSTNSVETNITTSNYVSVICEVLSFVNFPLSCAIASKLWAAERAGATVF